MKPLEHALPLVFLLLLLFTPVQGQEISQHNIEININTDGAATITEKFFLRFETQREINSFRRQAQELGADLGSWRSYNAAITNYVGDLASGSIAYEEKEGDRFVKLDYTVRKPLFFKTEGVRQTIFSIDSSQFDALRQGSVFVIPSNTKLIFQFPGASQVNTATLKPALEQESLLTDAQENKRVIWSGHLTTSGNLQLEYTLEKGIAPTFGLSATLSDMVANGQASYLLAIALVGLGVIYFKRKSIQQKIENYLIENSSLEKTEKEETEIEN